MFVPFEQDGKQMIRMRFKSVRANIDGGNIEIIEYDKNKPEELEAAKNIFISLRANGVISTRP